MRNNINLASIKRFGADRSGSFAVITGAIAAVLMLSAGYAVNVAQLYNVKARLGHALDAAVTSTARDLTTGKIEPKDARGMVEIFLEANGDPKATLGGFVLDALVVDQAAKTVEATAYVDVDLYFPLFQSGDTRRVANVSAAVYSDKEIEVAMMLDVTGSMSGQKIKDLKAAAGNAIDAFLLGQDPAKPRVRVSIVPYADGVNTGALANVVYAEKKFTTSEPPKLDEPKAASASKAKDDCATERKGSQQFTDASPYAAMVNRDYRLAFCPKAALKPLSADIKALKATISGFKAEGHTGGHMGIQWSWYMLSPRWANVLPKAAEPQAHDAKKVAKYAILMTDGEFNTAFAGVAKGGNTLNQPTLSRSHAEKLCAAMRKDGIEVFTVGFMLKSGKGVLQNCASKDAGSIRHYYDTDTGDELNAAFLEIARNIERLAITK